MHLNPTVDFKENNALMDSRHLHRVNGWNWEEALASLLTSFYEKLQTPASFAHIFCVFAADKYVLHSPGFKPKNAVVINNQVQKHATAPCCSILLSVSLSWY